MTPRRILLIVLAAIGASVLVVVAVSYWPIPADEHAYWLAGQRLLAGEPLYDPTAASNTPYVFWYPPIVAQVLAPITAIVPSAVFSWAWIVLMLGCLWWLAGGNILIALAMCAFPPIAVEFVSRNVHLIIAVLLVLGLRQWGGWFSVGAAIKLVPVLGIPYLALRGRIHEALVATGFGAVLLVVSVILAPDLWRQFFDVLRSRGPADASTLLPIPYAARLVAGIVLMVVAARLEPRIGEPLLVVAVTVAMPTLWLTAFATLAAVVPFDSDATDGATHGGRHDVTDRNRVSPVILAIFILSGAAALIDEIVWSRQLVLVFGNTTQAVSAILAGFFGGIAIGSFVGGRLADRVRDPLRMYGLLELALAVIVVLTPLSFRAINGLYRGIYPSLEGSPGALALLRVSMAVLALAPATVLMGATLPTLTRYLARRATLSDAFSRLYAANTIGAIIGTTLAGFVLIEVLGLTGALAVGAACSLVAGLAALALDRRRSPAEEIETVGPPQVPAGPSRLRRTAPRLALTVAFISGLTSLGYQVAWTRLLASGSGNTTYVFSTILVTFLYGITIGAIIYAELRTRLGDPVRLLAVSQVLAAVLALVGLVFVLVAPHEPTPGDPVRTIVSLVGTCFLVVLPVTIALGIAFPASSALLQDEASHAGEGSGGLLATNTIGAILGSLVVPFFLIPLLGSPALVAGLALVNAGLGIALGLGRVAAPAGRWIAAIGTVVAVAIVTAAVRPGVLPQPGAVNIASHGGQLFASTEDEIASVQAGQISFTPELWVAGTSMTLLTIDAKLMPVLPVIARPESNNALVVAFGMGSAYRGALIVGLTAEGVELVPSVPKMFGYYYADAAEVMADPNGKVIITDGRNHLELADTPYDVIITDPPPPLESSGASVISSKEYYEAGRDHLTEGGIVMQWLPYGAPTEDFNDHIRTFTSVFPEVTLVKGAGGYGVYMMGSSRPITLDEASIRSVLARPGVLEDISSAYDSPAKTADEWVDVIARQTWASGDDARAIAGPGPVVTDDRPRTEYFLLRRAFGIDGF